MVGVYTLNDDDDADDDDDDDELLRAYTHDFYGHVLRACETTSGN